MRSGEAYECPRPACRTLFVGEPEDDDDEGYVVTCPRCLCTFDPSARPKRPAQPSDETVSREEMVDLEEDEEDDDADQELD